MTIIVNLFGQPGAGKSTTAAGVFSLLKLHGLKVELVPEYAKELVYEKRHQTLQNEVYVFGKQHHALWRVAQNNPDVIVTDSPFLLCLQYCYPSESMLQFVMEEYKKYKNKNYFLTATKPYMEFGRNQTKEEAMAVGKGTKSFLDEYHIPHEILEGSAKTINIITNQVLGELGIAQQYFMSLEEQFD